jgi:hypothetical protein
VPARREVLVARVDALPTSGRLAQRPEEEAAFDPLRLEEAGEGPLGEVPVEDRVEDLAADAPRLDVEADRARGPHDLVHVRDHDHEQARPNRVALGPELPEQVEARLPGLRPGVPRVASLPEDLEILLGSPPLAQSRHRVLLGRRAPGGREHAALEGGEEPRAAAQERTGGVEMADLELSARSGNQIRTDRIARAHGGPMGEPDRVVRQIVRRVDEEDDGLGRDRSPEAPEQQELLGRAEVDDREVVDLDLAPLGAEPGLDERGREPFLANRLSHQERVAHEDEARGAAPGRLGRKLAAAQPLRVELEDVAAPLVLVLRAELRDAAEAELGVELDGLPVIARRRQEEARRDLAGGERREGGSGGERDPQGQAIGSQPPYPSDSKDRR